MLRLVESPVRRAKARTGKSRAEHRDRWAPPEATADPSRGEHHATCHASAHARSRDRLLRTVVHGAGVQLPQEAQPGRPDGEYRLDTDQQTARGTHQHLAVGQFERVRIPDGWCSTVPRGAVLADQRHATCCCIRLWEAPVPPSAHAGRGRGRRRCAVSPRWPWPRPGTPRRPRCARP